MECKFDASKCTSKCEKYAMCSFKETQLQIMELSGQINSLFKTMNDLTKILLKVNSDSERNEENNL